METIRVGKARRVGQVLGVAGWLAVVAVIASLIVPNFLGYDRYVIVSGSMHPVYDRGSVIFSKPVPVGDLKAGDIVTYTPPAATGINHLVSHRISKITTGQDGVRVFRTKGDANPGEDPWVFSLVRGKQNVMHFTIPYVGYALIALSNPHVRIAVIGVPAALIGVLALIDLVGEPLRRRRLQAA